LVDRQFRIRVADAKPCGCQKEVFTVEGDPNPAFARWIKCESCKSVDRLNKVKPVLRAIIRNRKFWNWQHNQIQAGIENPDPQGTAGDYNTDSNEDPSDRHNFMEDNEWTARKFQQSGTEGSHARLIPGIAKSRNITKARELGLSKAATFLAEVPQCLIQGCPNPAKTPSGKTSRVGLCIDHTRERETERARIRQAQKRLKGKTKPYGILLDTRTGIGIG